ncbi:MAG: hypothetical protein ACR2NZ_14715 [Rubripirellula sp.]
MAFDGVSSAPAFCLPIQDNSSGGAVPKRIRSRPVSVALTAELANLDADAEPDGWRAQIVLLDREDQPVLWRANATFELMPRVDLLGGDYTDAQAKPIRWSMPLEFGQDAIADVRLPLRQSLRPVLGWTERSTRFRLRTKRDSDREFLPNNPHRTFVVQDVRDAIARPTYGVLRVRVSVPTEGTFKAAVGVRIRPSVLVDTQWPYR